jgi:hypothetical protein
MAHFYGRLRGKAKTEATRCGGKAKGLQADVAGWDIGVHIDATHDPYSGSDLLTIYVNEGSNAPNTNRLIGYVSQSPHGPVFIPAT